MQDEYKYTSKGKQKSLKRKRKKKTFAIYLIIPIVTKEASCSQWYPGFASAG